MVINANRLEVSEECEKEYKNINIVINKAIKVQRHFFEIDKAKRISSIMKLTAMKGIDDRKSK